MTAVATLAGAPPYEAIDWSNINWKKVHRNVRRLQARIVKAIEAGRWGKVKALQWLLTHSFSGKALAVRRVTENRGKKTPGVDGEIWDTPKKKARAIQSLRQRGYRAQPLRRTYIPKRDGKRQRPLGIPTMRDRAMQALYKLALDPIAETTGDPNSYGFRRERSPADAIAQCFLCFRQTTSPIAVYEGDIRGCFDNISHAWLLENIPIEKRMLKQWLKAGYIDRNVFYPTADGTPQGGIISPVLANMTLDGLEAAIASQPHRGTQRQAKLHLIRFADDFVITGSSQALLGEDIEPGVVAFLAERGLELSAEKTKLTDIKDGFDFLGQNVRKYNGKLLIKPSQQSVKAFLAKARGIIKANPGTSAGQLIVQLNPLIRGWANYHCHVVSKKIFKQVDHAIFQALWRWASGVTGTRVRAGSGTSTLAPTGSCTARCLTKMATVVESPCSGPLSAHPTACQGQGGSQPLRPQVGALLRETASGQDGDRLERATNAAILVAFAKRGLSGLWGKAHRGNRVGTPSHGTTGTRRPRHGGQPDVAASHLSQASSQPGFDCAITASYHRMFERLERCALKGARTVLRGLGASNGPWLPDRRLRSPP